MHVNKKLTLALACVGIYVSPNELTQVALYQHWFLHYTTQSPPMAKWVTAEQWMTEPVDELMCIRLSVQPREVQV